MDRAISNFEFNQSTYQYLRLFLEYSSHHKSLHRTQVVLLLSQDQSLGDQREPMISGLKLFEVALFCTIFHCFHLWNLIKIQIRATIPRLVSLIFRIDTTL